MINHLNIFINMIKNKETFSLIRPSDGEYYILKNKTFTNIDNWFHSEKSTLSTDLKNAINTSTTLNNIYIGIPCKDCGEQGGIYKYYTDTFNIPVEKITYANIFGTYNYKTIINFLKNEKVPFYYIGSGTKDCDIFNIIDRHIIDEFLVNNWDSNKNEFITKIDNWIESKDGIFLFSIGPISKIIIPYLFSKYPNKTLIDIGSPLDIYLKNTVSRPYMIDNSNEGNQICDFDCGHRYVYNNIII